MSLRTLFKSLLEPKALERFVNHSISLKIIRYRTAEVIEEVETLTLGPFPSWFTLYEIKLALWNLKARDPVFSPPLVFIGTPNQSETGTYYTPLEMVWMSLTSSSSGIRERIQLVSPISLMSGTPDTRFVDSAGEQKAIGKDNRLRMILNDVFQLDDGIPIPELHVFLYADLVDRIPGPRPLSERDAYGRIMPYFPYLDPLALPPSNGVSAITPILISHADQTKNALKQVQQLEELLKTSFQVPKLDGVKFMRWVWKKVPEAWEGPSVVFFGIKVTHTRPYMRFFSSNRQPLTKVRVKGLLPIPDLPSSSLLTTWKQDKNPDVGKDCTFLKLRVQEESEGVPLYATMRVFNDGTADLLVMPPKQKRLLDPYIDLQDAPEVLDKSLSDTPYSTQLPDLGQADVVLKIRMKREDTVLTKAILQRRLKAFSSIFQEIPALPDEQPLIMLRYKGVSNFSSEDRIFTFLTQIAAHEIVEGEVEDETWVPRVSQEFNISMDEARRQVVAWIAQRNEYTLAVPETRDYILNKNPGIDIAIFAQHPIYNLHLYRAQSFEVYTTIINLLGLFLTGSSFQTSTVITKESIPVIPDRSPAVDGVELPDAADVEESGAFFPDDDDVPEFMRGTMFQGEEEVETSESQPVEAAVEPALESAPPITPSIPVSAPIISKKPTDLKAIAVKKYYIDRLKVADPEIFNYEHKATSDRGYVTHCAANESRQPIVLDNEEYAEMRKIYENDRDLSFVVYPEDPIPSKFQKKQPTPDENTAGKLDARIYPSELEKEIITLVRYGSKAKRINYYFCPRLFCIKDRLMVRYKDFKASVDRNGEPKPANSCPFCNGSIIPAKMEDKARDPSMTILERKTRPGSTSERHIYIGFLGKKKTPTGLSLPCCFADPGDRFDVNNPEFVSLGLRSTRTVPSVKPLAQPLADRIMGTVVEHTEELEEPENTFTSTLIPRAKYEPNYYRVLQGVSVKSIVDANRIPLEIVIPKITATDDPKAGPQIGLLPEALDKFFLQDSTSDKFADRLEIVRKLKPNAKGFLRLAIDNSAQNRNQALLSAIAPFLAWQPTAEKLIENMIEPRIPPRQFLQLNGGNLVHEFFNKCERKQQNDMRTWVAKYVGIDELKSSNIPAIERLMNSYECFKNYLNDPSRRKDLRVFYQALSEPGVLMVRGILFIVLEVTIEDIHVKQGDKSEFKREIKFQRVRCPAYPLSEGQQKADIGFLVHYNEVLHDRYSPEKKTLRHLGWEPLFYVDGTMPTSESRHRPSLFFQRSQEASWPPIVQKRVAEFFYSCVTVNRGPFTSQYGMDPNALIGAQEMITGIRVQPNGIIRDSYNHFVGIAYRMPGKSYMTSVPIADDGSIHFERRLFLDWDDFDPAPVDSIIDFYIDNVVLGFPQYRGYVPNYIQRSRDTQKVIGLVLKNGFSIPASDPKDPSSISEMRSVEVDDLEWDINRTIAYEDSLRRKAFKDAGEDDPKGDYVKLTAANIEDEIEDVYQHLRLTFSNWLATPGAGRDTREALRDVLKRKDLPLNEKRKRLDILLEDKVTGWLEPRREGDEETSVGFLRVDCLVQGKSECGGSCKWSSETSTCKIHSPVNAINPNGTLLQVPRLLYLRLVDELIRFAAKKEEIFSKQVPRLTIRKDAQRQGDQYIIPEDSPDWNSWWELLRTEWMTPEKEVAKFFDEQYEPIPTGVPSDGRVLPSSLKDLLGSDTKKLVWNPSTGDLPFLFLKSILRAHPITEKTEPVLTDTELEEIAKIGNVSLVYIAGTVVKKRTPSSVEAIVIAIVDGTVGWISQNGTYSVKVPLSALPFMV